MKHIIYILLLAVCSTSLSAQTVELYKNGHLICEYNESEVDSMVIKEILDMPTIFSFDNWYTPNGRTYQLPYEQAVSDEGMIKKKDIWSSINSTLELILSYQYGASVNSSHYGSSPTTDAISGYALKLKTINISAFDQNSPFVSGCLFLGEFDGTETDAQKATHIGMPYNKKPLRLKFWYKYHPGDLSGNYAGQTDEGLIKAVLFRSDKIPYMNGTTIRDNSNENVIAYAEFSPKGNVNYYTQMELQFIYTGNTVFRAEDMNNWKYSLALYFASSKNGDKYIGSDQTELYIDNVEIISE